MEISSEVLGEGDMEVDIYVHRSPKLTVWFSVRVDDVWTRTNVIPLNGWTKIATVPQERVQSFIDSQIRAT
ncbi:MAG: hypothetical protein HYT49_02375 [Candidatus Wildermuthbacteria bacterium]|nr:hypothetical protein [Candidatus Wildermuthbacteria bacterium]